MFYHFFQVLKVFNRFVVGDSDMAVSGEMRPVESTGAPMYADDGEDEDEMIGRPRTLRRFR